MIPQPLLDYYRCPQEFLDFHVARSLEESKGFFRFGRDVICYGQTSGYPCATVNGHLFDALSYVRSYGRTTILPFELAHIVDNLRYERYVDQLGRRRFESAWIKHIYYLLRPFLQVSVRRYLQKVYLRGWDVIAFPTWPVDCSIDRLFEKLLVLAMQTRQTDRLPFIWFWPEGYAACAIVTHDIETAAGRDFARSLMDIDDAFGIKTSFQIVPEKRYAVSPEYLASIRERGFEIGVQGLTHDGRLFWNHKEFLRRAKKINGYAKQYGAKGFRSPIMYRNVDWLKYLCFSYDMSVPNVAHLEPQRGGCCTIMPYFLPGGMLELPLTTLQDYSLFHILAEYSTALWRQQIRRILDGYGLMSFLIHPDYVMQHRTQKVYTALLEYLQQLRSDPGVWVPLPREVDCWWRERNEMKLISDSGGWRIEGPGSHRARLAYARLESDRLVYEVETKRCA
jgi:hypothetical protein